MRRGELADVNAGRSEVANESAADDTLPRSARWLGGKCGVGA